MRHLEEGLRSWRAAHAYLLSGPPGVGVMTLARQMAQTLLCKGPNKPCGECRHCRRISVGSHADLLVLRPTGAGSIGIEAVRDVQAFASLQPFEARGRVLIVDGAEAMTRESATALLKLLQEPPSGVTFILTTADEEAVLETVRSRCQPVRLRPLPFEQVAKALREQGVAADEAEVLARAAGGRLEAALALVQDKAPLEARREALEEIVELVGLGPTERLKKAGGLADGFYRDRNGLYAKLDLWTSIWRDALLARAGAPDGVADLTLLKQLESLKASVQDAFQALAGLTATTDALKKNGNPRLALEALFLSLPRVP